MKSLLLLLCIVCTTYLFAQQPGTLNLSFANKGILIDTPVTESLQNGFAMQPDGKLLIGSGGYDQGFYTFKVSRFLPDGTIDNSFGNGGTVFTLLPGFVDPTTDNGNIDALAVMPDGRIVAAGNIIGETATGFIGAVRYKPDGTLDSSFGTNGITELNFPGIDFVSTIALQADGKILFGGTDITDFYQETYQFYTARCLTDGNIDLSYGKGGMVLSPSTGGVNSIAVQPDGKIVAAGYSGSIYTNATFRIERYNEEDGSYDNSFGTGGVVNSVIGNGICYINDLVLQNDGKMVVAGSSNGYDAEFTLVRYNPDGSFDNSFGTSGISVIPFTGNAAVANTVLLTGEQQDKIVAAGLIAATGGDNFIVAGYNTDGTLDPTFGNEGIQTTDLGYTDDATSSGVEPDGKIVVFGNTLTPPGLDLALVDYYGYPVQVSLTVRIKRFLHNHGITWNGLPAEDKIAYYSVEQSPNSRKGFTQVAKVSGRSNLTDYSITNSNLLQGMNYYRVKAVSTDGTIRYSEVVSADNTAASASVFPNPARDYVTVQGLPSNTTANISIADGSGNIMAKGVSQGSTQYRFQIGNLYSGTYYINITTGSKTEVLKFVKE